MSILDDLLARLTGRDPVSPGVAAAVTVLGGQPGQQNAAPAPAQAEAPPLPLAADPIPLPDPAVVEPLPGLRSALKACAPRLADRQIDAWMIALSDPLRRAGVTTPRRVAAFVGQCAVESGCFRLVEEILDYSAERLCQVWPKRFPTTAEAAPFAHNPEALANRVYANRMGNRDPESGDGWRFRGRGLIQLTGRSNYERFAHSLGCTVEQAADHAATQQGAADSAVWFWTTNQLNPLADSWAIDTMTKKINGGGHGAAERRRLCDAALSAIGE